MITTKLLDLPLNFLSKEDILELFKKDNLERLEFRQIISINSENLITTRNNSLFKQIVTTNQNHIVDGVGVVWAIRFLYGVKIPQLTGVDLMETLLKTLPKERSRILLIGGQKKVAETIAECYSLTNLRSKIVASSGFLDVFHPTSKEENSLKNIVTSVKPHLVFVSFGSPVQEIWIEEHKHWFPNSVVIGVGGAFDFLSGKTKRAPKVWQKMGLEWLFRLLTQPWRIKRQWKILLFIFLIFKTKFFPVKEV